MAGEIWIAPDFDALPDDTSGAFKTRDQSE
jgi:hypothetical protein